MTDIKVISNIDSDIIIEKLNKELIKQGWTPPPKPKQKVIKLDEMIGSDVDMEFQSLDDANWHIAKLEKIVGISYFMGGNWHGSTFKCRIRENHWFYEPHGWGKCPIPDGLEVVLRSKYGGEETTDVYINRDNWKHGGDETIIAFQVISTADDARYEWQLKQSEDDDS